jgi:hypothetical protein
LPACLPWCLALGHAGMHHPCLPGALVLLIQRLMVVRHTHRCRGPEALVPALAPMPPWCP